MHRVLLILLMLPAMAAQAGAPQVLRGLTMGTTYQIKLAAGGRAIDAEQLHQEIEETLAEIDRQMSTYRDDSELSRFNRAPAGEWIAVSPAVAQVVAAAQAISEKTGGAMDVTVGPLVRLWHFGPLTKGSQPFVPPSEESLAGARSMVGYSKLEVRLERPALRKKVDGLEVDLSSIAPGFAIDRLCRLIEQHGVANYLVELGGEIRASGMRAEGQPWRVAIERPLAGRHEMQQAIPLRNAAIATAGDYQKFFEYEGKRYSHVIDPARGRPIEHELASVTVVAESGIAADGWDTPLLVLGAERGYACAEEHGIAAMFIAHGEGLVVRTTSAWDERFGALAKEHRADD